jgi:hypothetical protein
MTIAKQQRGVNEQNGYHDNYPDFDGFNKNFYWTPDIDSNEGRRDAE